MVVEQKISGFKETFVSNFRDMFGHFMNQICEVAVQEFEREVSALYNDVMMYRHELTRVADLLGQQLARERQLHGMLEKIAEHQTSIAQSAQYLAQQSPDSAQVHTLVDQTLGQHVGILQQTLSGMSQAQNVISAGAQQAAQLKDQMITADNEFNRIMQLLSQPVVPGAAPLPTVARTPTQGRYQQSPPATVQTALVSGIATPPPASPASIAFRPSPTTYMVAQPQVYQAPFGTIAGTPRQQVSYQMP